MEVSVFLSSTILNGYNFNFPKIFKSEQTHGGTRPPITSVLFRSINVCKSFCLPIIMSKLSSDPQKMAKSLVTGVKVQSGSLSLPHAQKNDLALSKLPGPVNV